MGIAEDFATVHQQLREQQLTVLQCLPVDAPGWIKQLTLAAGQFIVDRYQDGLPAGKTVIAGYPWFADWGRDTHDRPAWANVDITALRGCRQHSAYICLLRQ